MVKHALKVQRLLPAEFGVASSVGFTRASLQFVQNPFMERAA